MKEEDNAQEQKVREVYSNLCEELSNIEEDRLMLIGMLDQMLEHYPYLR